MVLIEDIIGCIREMAHEDLAEPWDNCGLIVSSENKYTECVAVCLDVTRAVIEEAAAAGAHLIISHHPVIFNPIRRIDADSVQGGILRALIKNDISVYSAHTNVDTTYGGLNDLLAGLIGLENIMPDGQGAPLSYYRAGDLPSACPADEFYARVGARLRLDDLVIYPPMGSGRAAGNESGMSPQEPFGTSPQKPFGTSPQKPIGTSPQKPIGTSPQKPIGRVLVMCGAFSLDAGLALGTGADALVCGEIRHHDALELAGAGMHVIQAGHHGVERFFISLAEKWIKEKFPDIKVLGVGFNDSPMRIFHGGNAKNGI